MHGVRRGQLRIQQRTPQPQCAVRDGAHVGQKQDIVNIALYQQHLSGPVISGEVPDHREEALACVFAQHESADRRPVGRCAHERHDFVHQHQRAVGLRVAVKIGARGLAGIDGALRLRPERFRQLVIKRIAGYGENFCIGIEQQNGVDADVGSDLLDPGDEVRANGGVFAHDKRGHLVANEARAAIRCRHRTPARAPGVELRDLGFRQGRQRVACLLLVFAHLVDEQAGQRQQCRQREGAKHGSTSGPDYPGAPG